jgi:hypothetical protein
MSSASFVYGEYLKDELARQDARKASFEQRGIAVVTTAGTLVTLLFGLAALSKTTTSQLGHEETVWLGIGLVLFVACAGFALATNFPAGYQSVDAPGFAALVDANPENASNDAEFAVADVRLDILDTAQKKNSRKGSILFVALILELVAVFCVGVAIFEVVVTSPSPVTGHEEAHHAPPHHEAGKHRHHHAGVD